MTRMNLVAVFVAAVMPVSAAIGQVNIDSFTVAQTTTASVDDAGILGGERDMREVSGADATIGSGIFQCEANFLTSCIVVYDGNDGDPSVGGDNQLGLSPTDFTAGGQSDIAFQFTLAAGNCNISILVCDSSEACANPQRFINTLGFTEEHFSFAVDFNGVDMTEVTFLRFILAPQTNNSDCTMGDIATTPVELQSFSIE